MAYMILMFKLALFIPPAFAVGYLEACSSSSECPDENYECSKAHPLCPVNICLCKEGIPEGNGRCLEAIDLGGACTNNTLCKPYMLSTCSNSTNTCVCDYGLREEDGACVSGNQHVNEPCTNYGDCKGFLYFSAGPYCINGTCGCSQRFVWDTAEDVCRYPKEGESCSARQCHQTYNCTQNATCQCLPDRHQSQITYVYPRRIDSTGHGWLLPICVLNTANTEVDIGGICGGSSSEDQFQNVCKTSLQCLHCFDGQSVCVQAPVDDTQTTHGEQTTQVSQKGDVTTTAGAASESHSLVLILPTVLWMKLC